ncbi:MAG: CAMP factor family pore-forming toxin [Rhodopirellula sp.]|nr:CAMP factor family pore-forming toxin [Rhodopirellula sp.]
MPRAVKLIKDSNAALKLKLSANHSAMGFSVTDLSIRVQSVTNTSTEARDRYPKKTEIRMRITHPDPAAQFW